jgi:hypothetical protein
MKWQIPSEIGRDPSTATPEIAFLTLTGLDKAHRTVNMLVVDRKSNWLPAMEPENAPNLAACREQPKELSG